MGDRGTHPGYRVSGLLDSEPLHAIPHHDAACADRAWAIFHDQGQRGALSYRSLRPAQAIRHAHHERVPAALALVRSPFPDRDASRNPRPGGACRHAARMLASGARAPACYDVRRGLTTHDTSGDVAKVVANAMITVPATECPG